MFLETSEAREDLTCCSGHGVIMSFIHKWTNLFNVNDDQDLSDSRSRRRLLRPRILLNATVLPHIVVPRAGAFGSCSSMRI